MSTTVAIDGMRFIINGKLTYAGCSYEGRSIEGLIFNSRMVQGIFDDLTPRTKVNWTYPDTGIWDPQRNVDEFCAMIPIYRDHGLLAVTVGLQGGGAIYDPDILGNSDTSAFEPDGTLRPAWLERLKKVLETANSVGMVVIVNYFYWFQEGRLTDENAVLTAARNATEWLIESGHRNIMIDVKNEVQCGDGLLQAGGIHRVVQAIREVSGSAFPLGTSTFPMPEINHLPEARFYDMVDFFMPHGNNSLPNAWRRELEGFLSNSRIQGRPVLCNEDSHYVENLDISAALGVSWGYYDQGFGSRGVQGKMDWRLFPRESRFDELSGFQTVPINWGINTAAKRAFFDRVRALTCAA